MILVKVVPMFLEDKSNVYLLLEQLQKIQISMFLMIVFLHLTLRRMRNCVENLLKLPRIKLF